MIRSLRSSFPGVSLHRMCQLLAVPRSLVYRAPWPKSASPVLGAVQELVVKFMGYGYRRVRLALTSQGYSVSEYHVRKLMRENGLLARRPKSKGCTRPRAKDQRCGNLVKGIAVTGVNQVWVADTTQFAAGGARLYLAAIMDLHSRMILGWSLSRRNDEELVKSCLRKALEARRPRLGWIHHSDQGSTYLAQGYTSLLKQFGARQSLSAPASPRDNAHMESFFRTLKLEEVDRNRYESFLEAKNSLETYIQQIYNQERIHSSLGYKSPLQFESHLNGEVR